MEEIKQLLDEAKRNLYDKDFVELHINLEAALNKVSNIVYGAEDEEAEEKFDFLKEEFNSDTLKKYYINKIMECKGVTKLKVEGEIKKHFKEATTVLIIE